MAFPEDHAQHSIAHDGEEEGDRFVWRLPIYQPPNRQPLLPPDRAKNHFFRVAFARQRHNGPLRSGRGGSVRLRVDYALSRLIPAVWLKPPSTYMISEVTPLARSDSRKAAALP